MRRIVALAAFFALFAAAERVWAQDDGALLKGATIARQICAECHAVQKGQFQSPNGQAPTFEAVATTPGMTSIALAAALRTSHRTMPNIILADDDLRNVSAYIISLR
jgi:mono/diheme cytochrome c family protein